jgi:hypothetical protein
MCADLVFKHVAAETELNKLEGVHEVLVLDNVVLDILGVVIDFKVLNDSVEFSKFGDGVGVEFFAIEGSEYFDEGSFW